MPHAGETTGPETVWDAVRLLGAERIGHGCSAAADPELLAHLAETGVVLEVCPTSNIATRAVDRIEDHPLRAFVDAGVTVTINSDDPPMFATTLNHDYEVAAGLLDLDERGVADLARAAVDASFAPEDVKARIGAEIDAHSTPISMSAACRGGHAVGRRITPFRGLVARVTSGIELVLSEGLRSGRHRNPGNSYLPGFHLFRLPVSLRRGNVIRPRNLIRGGACVHPEGGGRAGREAAPRVAGRNPDTCCGCGPRREDRAKR